jgi:hypothetical protein
MPSSRRPIGSCTETTPRRLGGAILCVAAIAGCGASTPHASPAVLTKALRAPFEAFARGDPRGFCADFTAPVARRIAIEVGRAVRRPAGRDCASSLASFLAPAHAASGAEQVASFLTVAAVSQHGVRAVARISDGKQIRFAFSNGRWRVAQVPNIEASYAHSSSGRPAFSSVLSFSF